MQIYKRHIHTNLAKRAFFALFCLILLSITSSCGSTKITPVTLYVTRSSPLRPLPSLNITITDKQSVQQLYQAAYNLPDASSDKRTCPEDSGIVYHLKFSQDKNTSEEMDMEASGCLILTTTQGLLQENTSFLDLVAKTIHVSPLVPPYQTGRTRSPQIVLTVGLPISEIRANMLPW